jgi:hypothetical protein
VSELIEWLRAQIDEDERVARATAEGGYDLRWQVEGDRLTPLGIGVESTCAPGYIEPTQAEHIARQDPDRTLAEVAAKRAILDEVVPDMDGMDVQIHGEWGVGRMLDTDYESWRLLRLMALPYAGQPGYREEWRP